MNYTYKMSRRIYFYILFGVIVISGFVLYKKTVIDFGNERAKDITRPLTGGGSNDLNKGTAMTSNDNTPMIDTGVELNDIPKRDTDALSMDMPSGPNKEPTESDNGPEKNADMAPIDNKSDEKKSTTAEPQKTVQNNMKDQPRAENLTSWNPPTVPEDLAHANQTDVKLINYIRDNWILPPFTGPRNLKLPNKVHFSQRGQSEYIDKLLKQRTNGFYIECGAAEGELLSNSLFFEKSRNWTGILIEANPIYFKNILRIRRHAYMMNACLSPSKKPMVLDFRIAGFIGGLTDFMEDPHKRRVERENGKAAPIKLQCFPLLSILRAMNITHVDYFSLDIEGAEFEILKHFPFDEIKVDVLTIEYVVSGGGDVTRKKLKDITDLMIGKYGYRKATYKGAEDIMLTKGV